MIYIGGEIIGAWREGNEECFGKKVAVYNQHWQDTIWFYVKKEFIVDAIFIVQRMKECYADKRT